MMKSSSFISWGKKYFIFFSLHIWCIQRMKERNETNGMWLVSKVLTGTAVAAHMRIIIICCVPSAYHTQSMRVCVSVCVYLRLCVCVCVLNRTGMNIYSAHLCVCKTSQCPRLYVFSVCCKYVCSFHTVQHCCKIVNLCTFQPKKTSAKKRYTKNTTLEK